MSEPILYAKAGGPPDNWHELEVWIDGVKTEFVTEANVTEGWADLYKSFRDHATERVYGRIELKVKPDV